LPFFFLGKGGNDGFFGFFIAFLQILIFEIAHDDLLFEESLPYFEEAGFSIEFKTYNLHEEKDIESFQTEHEKMFDEMGKTIKFLIARPSEQNKQI
jgi:hypothetical protein